jgi:hypothetical protein
MEDKSYNSLPLTGICGEKEALAIYNEVKKHNDFIGFTRQYMHDEDYKVARNALWSMTKATNKELLQLLPIYNELIDLAMTTENSSVCRLTLNIIERLPMEEDDLRSDFLDFCLEQMTKLEGLPGIQSLAMKLAHRMCKFYPELMDELIRTLKAMEMDYYKPAVKSVRKKILKTHPLTPPIKGGE